MRNDASSSASSFSNPLGHVATTYRNDTLSLASRRFMPQQKRFFLDDHNTPRTYEECMQETDIRLLKLKHIIK